MKDDQGAILFTMGLVVATPRALAVTTNEERNVFLSRHCRGSWEESPIEDRLSNHRAVLNGDGRVVSVHKSSFGVSVWIITEADRSATTILLPEDY